MTDQQQLNPFVPGDGQLPPHLAGRDAEQTVLKRLLAYVRAGRGAPGVAVLTGPRGNGKTALMRWFQQEIEAGKPAVDVLWMTPSTIRNLDALATEVAPPGRFRGMSPDTLSLSIGLGRAGWKLGGGFRSLARLLVARCRTQPLVLLLDEAQTLDQTVGQPLLNVSQEVRSEAPFLLALAGTPGLAATLNALSATFWDRCELIGVGRLTPDAAAEALTKPMAAQDPPISVTNGALGQVVESSQHYPYFLQLWGAALWSEVRDTGVDVVDTALVDRVQPAVERRKTAYYQNRYGELNRRPLLSAARAVAEAFAGKATLTENEFTRVIADSLPANTDAEHLDALDADLRALGFVWIPPGSTVLEAGIPSLMDFVREKALAG